MIVTIDSLLDGARRAAGTAVVVDVFRAFTCEPFMFSMGVERAILVATPEEAFSLKESDPDLLLIGEVGGIPVPGFDLGNSPSEILMLGKSFFQGRTVVHRTSAGVQGVLAAIEKADEVLPASFCTAAATATYLLAKNPERVSIAAMGIELNEKAPEDEWCARYIACLLGAGRYDHLKALTEILAHDTTRKFLDAERPDYPVEDPLLCLQRDLFDFALQARRMGDRVVVGKAAG